MKIKAAIIAMAALCGITMQARTLPDGFFARSSKLSSGNWVKITTGESGVYEISYETLRSMGFSNPEKVGVYGRGGKQLDFNFVSGGGSILYSDDLEPVAVYHFNDKLYFYGIGTRTAGFTIYSGVYENGGYFKRTSNNLYTDKGYYFLSDSREALQMEVKDAPGVQHTNELTTGLSYMIHEEDLVQNNSNSGQLFYGEKVSVDNPRLTWDVYLPGAVENAKGAMECYFYLDRFDKTIPQPVLSYGFEETNDFPTFMTTTYSSTNFQAQKPTESPLTVPGKHARVFVNLETDQKTDVSHIDYWTITYLRTIPDLIGENGRLMNQDFISFPKTYNNSSYRYYMRMPGGASFKVMDVTNQTKPRMMDVKADGADGLAAVINDSSIRPELIVFDPSRPQKQIHGYESSYEHITNQDLHAALGEGADLIIICIPELKTQAERLAELHRRKDGIKVVVATTEECYNEFSSGRPDPMAYRAAVKAAYSTPYSCKNLLLMGPLYADFRGVINQKNPEEGIIAYQEIPPNQERGANNANDYYGMMDEYLNSEKNMELNTVHVGVAIMPSRFPAEIDNVIDKVEKYLNFEDFAYYATSMTFIGGVGDDHTHDQQSIDLSSYVDSYNNYSTCITPLPIDAYGYEGAHKKLFSDFNEGRLIFNYFGHGGPMRLNHYGNFFNAPHVFALRNEFHPFFAFAGCDISNSDRGVRGLGETLVTSTPYGCIGSLLATRETWSGQNMQFFRLFYNNMFNNINGKVVSKYEKTPTIGEVYVRTKNSSDYKNELAYQLVCDPALRLPVATREIVLDDETPYCDPGDYVEINGYVPLANDKESIDGSFNGEVVIRVMEPFETITSADLASGEGVNKKVLTFRKYDTQFSMTSAEVKDGRFTAKLFIPERAQVWGERLSRLYVAAYSPESHVTAAMMFPIGYNPVTSETAQSKDNTAPTIDVFEFDPETCSINIKVSDNLALGYCNDSLIPDFKMILDGIDYKSATFVKARPENDGKTYSKNIPLYDLHEGSHTAIVTVKDAAGNEKVSEIIFTYLPSASKFAIELENGVVNGIGLFRSVSEAPDTADIVILDNAGRLVRREAFKNARYEWDGCDMSGNRVTKGLYKAYIIETGSHSGKGESAVIDVPVI